MDVKPDVKPPRDDNNHGGNDRHRGGRRYNNNNRNRYQGHNANATGPQVTKFKGKIKEIADNIFDNTGTNDAALFNKSLRNIADYLQLTLGNDVSEEVRNMAPITIVIPPSKSSPGPKR